MPPSEVYTFHRLTPIESTAAPPRVEMPPRAFDEYLGDANRASQQPPASSIAARQQKQDDRGSSEQNHERREPSQNTPSQETAGGDERRADSESIPSAAAAETPVEQEVWLNEVDQATPAVEGVQEISSGASDELAEQKLNRSHEAALQQQVSTMQASSAQAKPTERTPESPNSNADQNVAKDGKFAESKGALKGGEQVASTKHALAEQPTKASGNHAEPIDGQSHAGKHSVASKQVESTDGADALKDQVPKNDGQKLPAAGAATNTIELAVDDGLDQQQAKQVAPVTVSPMKSNREVSKSEPPARREPPPINSEARESAAELLPKAGTLAAGAEENAAKKSVRKETDDKSAKSKSPIATSTQPVGVVARTETLHPVLAGIASESSATVEGATSEARPSDGADRSLPVNNTAARDVGGGISQGTKAPASLVTAPRDAAGDQPALNTQERTRFVQRVANAFQAAAQQEGEIRLRLSPPELGQLKLEISIKQGVLTARMETDKPETRQVLLDNLPQLRDRLAEQSIKVEKFDVDVRDDGARHQADEQSDRAQRDNSRQQGARSESEAAKPAQAASTRVDSIGSDQLDIVI